MNDCSVSALLSEELERSNLKGRRYLSRVLFSDSLSLLYRHVVVEDLVPGVGGVKASFKSHLADGCTLNKETSLLD